MISMVMITNVTMNDLSAVLRIERLGFSPDEAGTATAFTERINCLQETFLVAKLGSKVVGFIVGPAVNEPFVLDEMYERTPHNLPHGGHQLVLSLATDPSYRRQGIGSQLLAELAKRAQGLGRQTMSLDSLVENVPFYEHNGFTRVGVSPSNHANEIWYHMVKQL